MSSSIEQLVRERYGSVAKSGLSSEQGGVRAVAEAFGYTAEELSSIPAEANMGLSCGNPTATASLRKGEVVVDLGSGGGRAVFREIARVLKPGGRLAVSDIALKRALPPEVSGDVAAYVGCIAGAIPVEEYKRGLIEAGFAEVAVIDSGADLNDYSKVENQSGCCSPAMESEAAPKGLPVAAGSCCGTASAGQPED